MRVFGILLDIGYFVYKKIFNRQNVQPNNQNQTELSQCRIERNTIAEANSYCDIFNNFEINKTARAAFGTLIIVLATTFLHKEKDYISSMIGLLLLALGTKMLLKNLSENKSDANTIIDSHPSIFRQTQIIESILPEIDSRTGFEKLIKNSKLKKYSEKSRENVYLKVMERLRNESAVSSNIRTTSQYDQPDNQYTAIESNTKRIGNSFKMA